MDDMNAFEHQLASGLERMGGPGRRIDAMAMVDTVTTASGRWSVITRRLRSDSAAPMEGGFSMSSALKFVAAGVIVALFSGFLLAGLFTAQQGDEALPAAVTVSPAPSATTEATESPDPSVRTDLLPGVTLTVEAVEPGVFRVIDDGMRDVTSVEAMDLVAGNDGGIRLLRENEFLRLGSDEMYQWPVIPGGDHAMSFEVAPDGTMWVIPCASGWYYPKQCGDARRSSDGEEWTAQPCQEGSEDCQGFTVAPDGTVWATWRMSGTTHEGRWQVGHLGPTGWRPLDGDARYDSTPFRGYRRMWVTDAGEVYGLGYDHIYRYEDGGWDNVAPRGWFTLADVGPDGTIWLGSNDGLGRLADGEWAGWRSADILGTRYGFGYDATDDDDYDYLGAMQFEVAPDGSLWFSQWQMRDRTEPLVCDGIGRFDGRTLDRLLPGRCITSMDIAPDGTVWVLATDETGWVFDNGEAHWILGGDEGRDLHVITLQAVPTPEAIDTAVPVTTTSDVLPDAALTVGEVEPGVFHVLDDGVRDVEQVTMTAVGDDGSVWMDSASGILQLGRPGEHPGLVDGQGFLTFSEDGGLWAASADRPDDLRSFDGETWTARGTIPDGVASVPDPWWPADYILDFAVHPDGSVWQVGANVDAPDAYPDLRDAYPRLQHLDADTWTTYAVGEGLPNPGWCDLCVEVLGCECDEGWDIEITPDGTVWVGIAEAGLLRFDGTDWEVVRPLGGDEDHGIVGLASNKDGVLWAELESGHLARFDGRAWGAVSHAPAPDPYTGRARSVDPDGNLWVGSYSDRYGDYVSDGCDGIRRFDGSTWMTFLVGECVADIDIANDGSVWVRTDDDDLAWIPGYGYGGDLFVITPDAMAPAE
jgi:hypothetical protein